MTIVNRNLLWVSVILVIYSPALAGECPEPVLQLNSVEEDLTVRRNIAAGDLVVTVDGKRVPVASLSLSSAPRRVVLIVDTSASMHPSLQRGGWGVTLLTATFAAESTPDDAPVAMMTVSEKPQQTSGNFETRPQIERRVLDLAKTEPQGRTALFDSLDEALSLFGTPQPGDAIYEVSDGVDNKSHTPFAKLKEELVSRGVRVFLFLIPPRRFVTSEEEYMEGRTEELAEHTGGYVIRTPWREIRNNQLAWLETSAAQIRNQVQGIYLVKLDSTSTAMQGKKVKVVLNKRGKNSSTLAYPRQLAACPSQP